MIRGSARKGVLTATAVQVVLAAGLLSAGGERPEPLVQTVAPVVVAAAPVVTVPEVAPPTTAPPTTAPPAPPPVAAPAPIGPRRLVLIGDSMAYTAALGLAGHAARYGFEVYNEGIMGCGVVRGGPFRYFGATRESEPRCENWVTAWQGAFERSQPDMIGIVIGRWELMDRVYNGQWTNVFDPAFVAYLETEIDTALVLSQATGARPVMFTTPYYRRGLKPDGGLFPEDDPARVDAINVVLRRVAERRGIAVVDVGGWLSPEGQYAREVAGIRVRSDGVHLTRQTGDLLAPWLFPQLQAL